MFTSKSLLINPFIVLLRLDTDSIIVSTMALMADLLFLDFLICIALAFDIIPAAFVNERKDLSIIRKITGASTPAQFRSEL